MISLCTLFDHNYLDKGLALYESLENVCDDYKLYVLAMSEQCYDILSDLKYKNLIPIKLIDFESDELLEAKKNRSFGQYCFTCSSNLIKYILDKYQPKDCTYIDADLFFYQNPKVLIDEMYDNNKSVLITPHRFLKKMEKKKCKEVGEYCVEFNTFRNDMYGRHLLEVWRHQCLLRCDTIYSICWGDQLYLNGWPELYTCVHVTGNLGAGVAPWNIKDYKAVQRENEEWLIYRGTQRCKLVFYHFEGIRYISKNRIRMCVLSHLNMDVTWTRNLYYKYLTIVDKYKVLLKEKYNIDILLLAHPEYEGGVRRSFFQRFNIKKWREYIHQIMLRLQYQDKDYMTI